MRTRTFYGQEIGETAPHGSLLEQNSGNLAHVQARINTERTRRFESIIGGACRASKQGHACVYVAGHGSFAHIGARHFNAAVGFWPAFVRNA